MGVIGEGVVGITDIYYVPAQSSFPLQALGVASGLLLSELATEKCDHKEKITSTGLPLAVFLRLFSSQICLAGFRLACLFLYLCNVLF